MKKIIVLVVLITFVSAQAAFAWVNLALTAAELAAPYVYHRGVKYLIPRTPSANMPSRAAADTYGASRKAIGIYGGVAMAVMLTIAYNELKNTVQSDEASYPDLKNRLGAIPDYDHMGAFDSGKLFLPLNSTLPFQLDSLRKTETVPSNQWAEYANYRGKVYIYGNGPQYTLYAYNPTTHICQQFWCHMPDLNTLPQYSPAAFPASFDNPNNIPDSAADDIDRAITSNPNIVHFPDDAVINNAKEALSEIGKDTSADTVDSAKQNYENKKAAYYANPNDQTYKDMLDALKEYNDALSKLNNQDTLNQIKDNTDPNKDPGTPTPNQSDNAYDSTIETPTKNDLSGLITGFIASSPLASLINTFRVNASDEEANFSVHVYDRDVSFDFSQWSSYFAGLGAVLLAVSHGAAIYIVFRKGV